MGHNYQRHERSEVVTPLNPTQNETFESILQAYMSRRTLLKGAVTSLVLAYTNPLRRSDAAGAPEFAPLTHSTEDKLLVPPGYEYQVLICWGERIDVRQPPQSLP